MPDRQAGEITQLLQQFRQGDTEAMSQLLPYIYDELKQIAGRCLQPQHVSWQPTAMAHELFVHLFADETPDWENREHFFATASLKIH